MSAAQPLLTVDNLKKYFIRTKGFRKRVIGTVKAVDDASFHIDPGETLALVGESGSGKTTLGRSIIRAIEPTSGDIVYDFGGTKTDLTALDKRELKEFRRHLSIVFQDPFSSLNPRMNVMEIVGEPLVNYHAVKNRRQLADRVAELLDLVRLNPQYMARYPHAFSGGQRQRIAVARALALNPKFVVADEPVSALDVSVQAQVLNLLKELQARLDLTYLFVGHNLAVIEYVANRTAVMYVGRIAELGDTDEVFRNPLHPYTEALLSAVPKGDPDAARDRIVLTGDPADPANRPSGCFFHPRCRYAQKICREQEPPLNDFPSHGRQHLSACHFASELSLVGTGRGEPVAKAEARKSEAPTNRPGENGAGEKEAPITDG
ncbi:MAG: ABC transporter ATP-binding protein [Spirochaetaceae bacterium]|nr:MAG: ABC transporter ATP-binding protein [Spirochaetaceae bacterium]